MAAQQPPGHLRVRLLSGTLVDGLDDRGVGTRKARTLLRVLAVARGRPVRGERLIEYLWGERAPEAPADQLAVLVSRLRRVVGPDRLQHRAAGYYLNVDELDLDTLSAEVDAAVSAYGTGDVDQAVVLAERALGRVDTDANAEDGDAPWFVAERATASRLAERARVLLAEDAIARGLPERAVVLGERALNADPLDESALRIVMLAHSAAGRPGVALSAYTRMRALLGEELGVLPSATTEAVHDAIVLQTPGAGPAPPVPDERVELPGRAADLRSLDDLRSAITPGRALYAEVVGEEGIGKTTLLQSWGGGAGAMVVSCHRVIRSLPLQPLIDALMALDRARFGGGAFPLERVLGGVGPKGDETPLSFLGAGVLAEADLIASMTSALDRLGAVTPLLLVVDDADNADSLMIDVLDRVLARPPRAGALVVTTRHPGRAVRLRAPDVRLEPGPLDLDDVALVVGEDRAVAIFGRSGGHPLFVAELAAGVLDAQLPNSLIEAMRIRAEALGEAAVTLRAAAVLGSEIDLDLLAAVTETSEATTLTRLEAAFTHQFLREVGPTFAFRHELVREALAASTTASRRAYLHREAARWLDRRGAADPLRIVYHARLGGESALAAQALGAAANLALQRWAWAEAERLLDEALTLEGGPALLTARARVRLARGLYGAALDDALTAAVNGGGADALEVAGWSAYYARDFAQAARLAIDGLALATTDEQRSRALLLAGRLHHSNGDLAAAADRYTAAEALAGPPDLVATRIWRGALLIHLGRPAEALEALTVIDHSPAVARHPYANVHASLVRGQALALQGQSGAALRVFNDLDRELAIRGIERFAGRLENWTAWVLRNLGAHGSADDANRRSVEIASRCGLGEAWANALLDLADAAIRAADPDLAVTLLADAATHEQSDHAFRWRHSQRRLLLEARLALSTHDAPGAQTALIALRVLSGTNRTDRYDALAAVLQARVDIQLGREIELAALDPTLRILPRVAGLETWWLVGELAADLGSDTLWQSAADALGRLIRGAGDHGTVAAAVNGRHLDRLRP